MVETKAKLGFFLKPSSTYLEKLQTEKNDLLDLNLPSHFIKDIPHLTLLHGVYDNKKKILNDFLTSTLNINLPLEVKVLKPHIFYNDVENGFHSLTYLFEKNSEIINIQQKIIDKFKPDTSSKFYSLDAIYEKNIKQYNYPFVGNDLLPHITLGNIKMDEKDIFLKTFLKKDFIRKIKFDSIFIGEIHNDDLLILQERS